MREIIAMAVASVQDEDGRVWIEAKDVSMMIRTLAEQLGETPVAALAVIPQASLMAGVVDWIGEQADAFDVAVIGSLDPR